MDSKLTLMIIIATALVVASAGLKLIDASTDDSYCSVKQELFECTQARWGDQGISVSLLSKQYTGDISLTIADDNCFDSKTIKGVSARQRIVFDTKCSGRQGEITIITHDDDRQVIQGSYLVS